MSLPFDIPDKHKRKYQCFVCGIMFHEYSEYSDHIVAEHVEGREYVRCPLKRCQAPVRDVKTHFSAKHRGEPIPKNCQLRATVWKDWSPRKQKMESRRPNFKNGWHASPKANTSFYYRSDYERQIYTLLDQDTEVLTYEAEPFEIPYTWKGESRRYVPDILVLFADGHQELWEIKPADQTLLEQNQAKWKSAEAACATRNWKFVVINEVMMDKYRKKIQLQQAMGGE